MKKAPCGEGLALSSGRVSHSRSKAMPQIVQFQLGGPALVLLRMQLQRLPLQTYLHLLLRVI